MDIKFIAPEITPNTKELEYSFVGTAISLPLKHNFSEPLLSTNSASEFIKLIHAGTLPIGISLGLAFNYKMENYQDRMQLATFSGNQEVGGYSQVIYQAKNKAMANFIKNAKQLNGLGIVAQQMTYKVYRIEIDQNNNRRTDHVVQFSIMGTVIAGGKLSVLSNPTMAISLNDNLRGNII